jgi:hypothetical protein
VQPSVLQALSGDVWPILVEYQIGLFRVLYYISVKAITVKVKSRCKKKFLTLNMSDEILEA